MNFPSSIFLRKKRPKPTTPQQIKSIQVLGKFYENDLTKSWGELVPELILCYRKLFRLNAAERPTDALSSI